jgi:trimeric autotransporter adhesin
MTVDGTFSVDKVVVTANALDLSYVAATTGANPTPSVFSMTGAATVAIPNLNDSISVTFGSGSGATATPGLVVTGGSLTSLDLTITSDITVSKVNIVTDGLEFT